MKVIYDRETDTLSIILRPGKVANSDETTDGLIMDYDKAGKRKSLQTQIDATDRQIDTLVYELYGLTPDEIKIVEQDRNKSATVADAEEELDS